MNPYDINLWYSDCKGICPTCGMDMRKAHPAYNLFPHFMGACKPKVQP